MRPEFPPFHTPILPPDVIAGQVDMLPSQRRHEVPSDRRLRSPRSHVISKDSTDRFHRHAATSCANSSGGNGNCVLDDSPLKDLDPHLSSQTLQRSKDILAYVSRSADAARLPPIFAPNLPASSAAPPPTAKAKIKSASSGSSGFRGAPYNLASSASAGMSHGNR
jgi:hypothetical protein